MSAGIDAAQAQVDTILSMTREICGPKYRKVLPVMVANPATRAHVESTLQDLEHWERLLVQALPALKAANKTLRESLKAKRWGRRV